MSESYHGPDSCVAAAAAAAAAAAGGVCAVLRVTGWP
jgi:hypothetical protein